MDGSWRNNNRSHHIQGDVFKAIVAVCGSGKRCGSETFWGAILRVGDARLSRWGNHHPSVVVQDTALVAVGYPRAICPNSAAKRGVKNTFLPMPNIHTGSRGSGTCET